MSASSTIVVAAIQTAPQLGDVVTNLSTQRRLVVDAVQQGAVLVVLPECSTTGYCFASAAEAAPLAEDLDTDDGPARTLWGELARQHELHLVAGIVEAHAGELFNTAVLIGPDGELIGRYRKAHLWATEKTIYAPGDLGFPVYETAIGRIGMQICYDGWFPEGARLAAAQGADVLCIAANWVPVPAQHPGVPIMANMLCMTAAHVNLVYVVAASRVGTERGQPFLGRSLIVEHTGALLAGPASADREEVLTATIDPIGSRSARHHNPFNQPLRDRRTDLYDEMLGSLHEPGAY